MTLQTNQAKTIGLMSIVFRNIKTVMFALAALALAALR